MYVAVFALIVGQGLLFGRTSLLERVARSEPSESSCIAWRLD
jgi:hypothetical protein